jgi:hypothetical protein
MLHYSYPLDYGEGLCWPRSICCARVPVWQLYADPDIAPYAVVNYRRCIMATLLAALPLGDALLATA